ncbi:tRNA epoxyqueuosine(34) reductase QueG [Methylovirgula sp. 4M-Z18]|uniref:tRNA epoxyqueuosine(34) reductase QueG n=1 Tax=Methylovirgula sp. 4M-Z18 TaxID=2293567 RepID=UPI000E2F7D43|nr:tRNA epoxyqueuosine(34) reductase QueG [Methylovirgula sp. 4M-Z18]RFB75571.1 tRNA epoxyqueuosine(34) reductase QueG [Methylovirgula sp. 4M-Z18]
MQSDHTAFKSRLAVAAKDLGFDLCRIAAPDALPLAPERLAAWLALDRHGSMDWMQDTAARRADPRVLWPEVRSIVMLGVNYGPEEDPRATLAARHKGTISVYARNRDYHDVIKGKLKLLAQWLVKAAKPEVCDVKVFVDTAPVMEKPLAMSAGLGWQGKHTNLVSREFGSWLFLGSIFTSLPLAPDEAEVDHCGSCRACLDVCPTDAFPAPYQIDARRCISYLTIEHKGPIPRALRQAMGNRIYGCDDCLAVCPWNKFAQASREAKLAARGDLNAPDLTFLASLDDAAFRTHFSGSPIKRIGRDRFLRNVLIAIGNAKDPAMADIAIGHLNDESPVVRGAAVWALARLAPPDVFQHHAAQAFARETDDEVRAEWIEA